MEKSKGTQGQEIAGISYVLAGMEGTVQNRHFFHPSEMK